MTRAARRTSTWPESTKHIGPHAQRCYFCVWILIISIARNMEQTARITERHSAAAGAASAASAAAAAAAFLLLLPFVFIVQPPVTDTNMCARVCEWARIFA